MSGIISSVCKILEAIYFLEQDSLKTFKLFCLFSPFPLEPNQTKGNRTNSFNLSGQDEFLPSQNVCICKFPHKPALCCASALVPVQPHPLLSTRLLTRNVLWVCGTTRVIADSLHPSICVSSDELMLIGPGKNVIYMHVILNL